MPRIWEIYRKRDLIPKHLSSPIWKKETNKLLVEGKICPACLHIMCGLQKNGVRGKFYIHTKENYPLPERATVTIQISKFNNEQIY